MYVFVLSFFSKSIVLFHITKKETLKSVKILLRQHKALSFDFLEDAYQNNLNVFTQKLADMKKVLKYLKAESRSFYKNFQYGVNNTLTKKFVNQTLKMDKMWMNFWKKLTKCTDLVTMLKGFTEHKSWMKWN